MICNLHCKQSGNTPVREHDAADFQAHSRIAYRIVAATCISLAAVVGCTLPSSPIEEAVSLDDSSEEVTIPAFPLEPARNWGLDNLRSVQLPFVVHDTQYPIVGYSADGQPESRIYDQLIFPTHVWIVRDAGEVTVFFARSPHGGCLIRWEERNDRFEDPCYGSKFTRDGDYIEGPSPRNLDQLPAEIRDGVVWVTNRLIYGEELRSMTPEADIPAIDEPYVPPFTITPRANNAAYPTP